MIRSGLSIFVVTIILAVNQTQQRKSDWSQATNSMTSQHKRIIENFCKLRPNSVKVHEGFVRYQQFTFECQNINNIMSFMTSQCPRTCTNPVTCTSLDRDTYRVVKKTKIIQLVTIEGERFNIKVVDRCVCEAKKKCKARRRRKRNRTKRL